MFKLLGPDTGFDAIDDQPVAVSMNHFFSHFRSRRAVSENDRLQPESPRHRVDGSQCLQFQRRQCTRKMQYGAAWWFLDQIKGMEDQLNALSSLGLLSRFVGMLTDSRSFLSYPRHEYFRRILCNMLGNEIEKGLLPASELSFIGQMVEGHQLQQR